MRKTFVNLFLRIWLFFEKIGLKLVELPKIEPNKKTLHAFDLLKRIYNEAEKRNMKVWLSGSWAITGRSGGFFKNIGDIDLTMREREEEKRFASMLEELGLIRRGDSPMGANRYLDPVSKVEVDFGSITYPGTVYYQIPMDEKEIVELEGFRFRVIPRKNHLDIYKQILFSKGRSIKADLVKVKILALSK